MHKGKGWQSGDTDRGASFFCHPSKDLSRERGERQKHRLVSALFQQLRQHGGRNLIGLIVCWNTDNGTRSLHGHFYIRDGIGQRRMVIRQLSNQLRGALEEKGAARIVKKTFMPVLFGKTQRRQNNAVIEIDQPVAFEKFIGNVVSFSLVHCQKTLVKMSFWSQLCLVTEEDMQERHLRHIASHDNKADGEGRGKNQSRQ